MKFEVECDPYDLLSSVAVALEAIEHQIDYYREADHEPDADNAIVTLREVSAILNRTYVQIHDQAKGGKGMSDENQNKQRTVSVKALSSLMESAGWTVERQEQPDGTVMLVGADDVYEFHVTPLSRYGTPSRFISWDELQATGGLWDDEWIEQVGPFRFEGGDELEGFFWEAFTFFHAGREPSLNQIAEAVARATQEEEPA